MYDVFKTMILVNNILFADSNKSKQDKITDIIIELEKCIYGELDNDSNKYKYAIVDATEKQASNKYLYLFKEGVISIKQAQNLVVIKTLAGNGANAGAVVDKLNHDEIVGSVAGDDTLLVVCEDNDGALFVANKINDFIG
jgi:arginine repressor